MRKEGSKNKATKKTNTSKITDIKNFPGEGILGTIDKKKWFIGTEQFIEQHCSEKINTVHSANHELRRVLLANSDNIIASLYFTDPARPSSQMLIDELKQQGKRIILMSGDHESIVKQIAGELGITEYQAELKPEEKLESISKLQEQGEKVCMVGDGINDAPAFAKSDVAIAMSEASELTKLNADMLLLNHKIESLITMLKIVNKTNRTLHLNFAWAIGYNLIALPFAIMGFLAPWMAALGMSLSSLVVVINATRITTMDYN